MTSRSPARRRNRLPVDDAARRTEDLLGDIWLYIDWRYITRQLTTEQKNLFADAVDASSMRNQLSDGSLPGTAHPVADRWWDDDVRAYYPYCCKTGYEAEPAVCAIHGADPLLPAGTPRT